MNKKNKFWIIITCVILLFFVLRTLTSTNDSEIISKFYTNAKTGNWYIQENGLFQQVDETRDTYFALPKSTSFSTPLKLLETVHLGDSSLSPDGKMLVANSYTQSEEYIPAHFIIFDIENNFAPVHEDFSYTSVRSAPGGPSYSYQWSPNQKYISFIQGTQIQLMDTETYIVSTVATDHIEIKPDSYDTLQHPQWVDSNTILYVDKDRVINKIDINSKEKTSIVEGDLPVISPDRTSFVYFKVNHTRIQGDYHLYSFENNSDKKLFYLDVRDLVYWTPDNNFLLINREHFRDGTRETYLYSMEDSKIILLAKRKDPRFVKGDILSSAWVEKILEPIQYPF